MNTLHSGRLAIGVMASLGLAAGMLLPQDPPPKQLAVDRHEAARLVCDKLMKVGGETVADHDTRALWSRRLAEAAVDSGALPARDAMVQHLARMQRLLVIEKSLQEDGRRSAADVAVMEYHVAEARALAR